MAFAGSFASQTSCIAYTITAGCLALTSVLARQAELWGEVGFRIANPFHTYVYGRVRKHLEGGDVGRV